MKLIDHIRGVFDDAQAGKPEHALLHACITIDATAKKLYPSEISVGRRFIRCIREYYWLVEPLMGVGFNLVDTKFDNVHLLNGNKAPDFAEIIYYVHRCHHAHGEEVPFGFELTKSLDGFHSHWELAPNLLRMPDRVIWALTAISVFSEVNHRLRGSGGTWYISWGNERYLLSEWWGKENEIKKIAKNWNTTRLKIEGLSQMRTVDPTMERTEHLVVVSRPPQETS